MPRLEPPVTAVTEAFWNATRNQELVIQHCPVGDHPVWFPREVCPEHLIGGLVWKRASGEGTVYAFTVDHRQEPPRPVLMVELAEGPRLLGNLVDGDVSEIAVGMKVRVAWEPLSDGRNLPQFTPMGG